MSPQVVVAKQNTNAEQISARLLAGEFNGLPVVDDNGAVVGIVTALELIQRKVPICNIDPLHIMPLKKIFNVTLS